MLGPTARFGISHPALDRLDAPDIPQHLKNIVDAMESLAPLYGQGNTASRPTSTPGSPGKAGRFYMDTQVSPHILYYDHGTGWDTVGYLSAGSVTATELADLAVTTAKINNLTVTTGKLADLGVTTAKVADLAVTFGKLEAALKPSQGAGTGAEALRALGTAAGTAAAGDDSRFNKAVVATTVAGLPAGVDGLMAKLRVGASPYDVIGLIYDSTIGKWVSQSKSRTPGQASINQGTAGAWEDITAEASWFPYGVFVTAGLTLQVRLITSMKSNGAASLDTGYRAVTIATDGTAENTSASTALIAGFTSGTQTLKVSDWATVQAVTAAAWMRLHAQHRTNTNNIGEWRYTTLETRWVS